MVFDNIWEIWPFRDYFSAANTRKHNRQSSRCGGGAKSQAEPLIKLLGPWESNMVMLQSILIWEKPGRSALALFVTNVVYWYLAYSEVRFFFGISLLGLIAFLRHQWVNSIWPEISVPKPLCEQEDWTTVHPSVLSAPEVSRHLNNIWTYIQSQQKRLAQLHRKQPGWFCIVMVVIFSILWLLGRMVSGVTLLYILLMGVMCGPAFIFRFIPKSLFKKMEQIYDVLFGRKSSEARSDETELEEFLPEESSDEVQTALGIPLTSHELKDELSESIKSTGGKAKVRSRRVKSKLSQTSEVGSPFTVGMSPSDFPSLEDTTDTLEESDLALPDYDVDAKVLPTDAGMNFVSTHFGDSSDEDEEFSVGLTFSRNTEQSLPLQNQGENFQPSIFPQITSASVLNLINDQAASVFFPTMEQGESLLSVVGQHLASAIGSRVSALAPSSPSLPVDASVPDEPSSDTPTNVSEINVDSSGEEDFELISDEELQ